MENVEFVTKDFLAFPKRWDTNRVDKTFVDELYSKTRDFITSEIIANADNQYSEY